jgi:hypothetical protein
MIETIDSKLVRRLMARGHCEIVPSSISVPAPHWEECSPGCFAEHSTLRPAVAVVYCNHGQRHRLGWNPFATRTVIRETLTEALVEMEEVTRPREERLVDLVDYRMSQVGAVFAFMAQVERYPWRER